MSNPPLPVNTVKEAEEPNVSNQLIPVNTVQETEVKEPNVSNQLLPVNTENKKQDAESNQEHHENTTAQASSSDSTTLNNPQSSSDYEEWLSDSTFDYDEDDMPLEMPKYIAVAYEGNIWPFEVKKVRGRIMKGTFFTFSHIIRDMHLYIREETIWVKVKTYVKGLEPPLIRYEGSSRRQKVFYAFEGV